ncbi:MAG TPA: tripartite tricarboxylate transporter substrate binding protein [Burkholderiales bacterium]|jgi:tripartite-type tricarboxylate transporter receptor subunit TctC|nr:tripartite tricarboxylate transporter substrate binding protein [Burkholderiales bacterium]
MRRLPLAAALLCAATLAPQAAQAQAYPNHVLTLVVPYAPGGNIDLTARALAKPLGIALGQPVVVENRPGAGGMLGSSYTAHAAPDGYNLLLGSSASVTTAPAVYKNVPFDPVKNLTALGSIQSVALVLTTPVQVPVKTYADLVAYSQNRSLNIGTSGIGSLQHLAVELMVRQSKLRAVAVAYKGSNPALTDLLGGQIDGMTDQLSTSLPYIRDGRIRAVAQLGRVRSPLLPEVATLIEQGVPNFEAVTFTGLFAPANLPRPVEAKLTEALAKALADPDLRKTFKDMGAEMMEMSQPQFTRFVAADLDKWKAIGREAKIVIDN